MSKEKDATTLEKEGGEVKGLRGFEKECPPTVIRPKEFVDDVQEEKV